LNWLFFYILLVILSFLLTFLIKKIAVKKKVVDIPNERSSHTTPTPRGGGLAIVVCWFLGITTLVLFNQIDKYLFYALLSGIILAIVGVLDDVLSLKPNIRLIMQAISAILAIYFLGGFEVHFIQSESIIIKLIIGLISVVAVVWFINIFNFLDGIDAYASIEAIFIASGIYLFTNHSVNLILIFSILGFLIWNWPKAKIFMGDVGSTQLGFILVVLGIYFHNSNELNIIYWLMLSSLFWFDASYTLFRRWRNKESISTAHKKHAYQRIAQSGFSHLKTNVYALLINLLILLLIYVFYYFTISEYYILIIIITGLFIINNRIDKKFPFSL
jgi:UDP-N-acetylmuramyl pentapeptide phosphotransferase/UDP-N-acetylglucosamine-1-phosphate transferase